MGYLEDMATAAGIRSLGELARQAVAAPGWPGKESKHPRTVGNMLGHLDRGERKGQVWLDNRPEVQQVLAEILGVAPEELDPGLQEPDAPADPRVQLTELVEARPIDLRREPLYPGIPRAVLEPAGWRRGWWEARAGSGKTLVGRWLEARGLATYLRVQDLSEAISRMPAAGPVYIELTGDDDASAVGWAELEDRCVCVAASWVHRDLQDQTNNDRLLREWSRITSPSQEDWLEPLIRWVGERMQEGGAFNVEAMVDIAVQWSEFLKTPGDCIGLCGVMEVLGAAGFEGNNRERLAKRFLEAHIGRPDLGGSTTWKVEDLWKLIVGCIEGIWVHTGHPDASPSVKELCGWLREDALPPGDSSAFMALADDPELNLEKVEQAKQLARPTANGAINELIRLKLIETERGRATLRPTWLVQVAEQAVRERLLAEPQRGLGRVLLSPEGAVWWLGVLRDRFLSGGDGAGWSLVRYALDSLDAEDAASVVLLEAVFRAVGIALLSVPLIRPSGPPSTCVPSAPRRGEGKMRLGDEDVELLHHLWYAQMRVAVDFRSMHENSSHPLILPRCFNIDKYLGFDMDNTWMLSALSISEHLHHVGIPVSGPFVPWERCAPTGVDEFFFSRIGNLCRMNPHNGEAPDYALDAWRLMGRLYRHFGGELRTEVYRPDHIEAPFVLFEAMRAKREAVWRGAFLNAARSEQLWEHVFCLGADEGFSREQVMVALWKARDKQGGPALTSIPSALCEEMMRLLPIEILAERYSDHIIKYYKNSPIDYHHLNQTQWSVVLDIFKESGACHHLALLPKALVRRVLREQDHYHTSLPEDFWDRYPGICAEEAAENLIRPPLIHHHASMFFWMAPERYVADIIRHLRSRMQQADLSPEVRSRLIRWARARALRRGPGWREAWKLLQELSPVPEQ